MKRSVDKKISGATGAPSASFLSALEGESPIRSCVTQSRKERKSFCQITTNDIGKRVWLDLMELAERIDNPKMTSKGLLDQSAAQTLAKVAIVAAQLLENSSLSNSDYESQMLGFAAGESAFWPVLLRLGDKRNKKGERCLESADRAKAYLIRIGQGQGAAARIRFFYDHNSNIFKRSAELLLHELVRWRDQGAWINPVTSWAKRLFALGDLPMTSDNVKEWWAVAKLWMDEQWATNPELFAPLVAACSSQGKSLAKAPLYEAEKKSRVIDLRLREAFFALAKPADL